MPLAGQSDREARQSRIASIGSCTGCAGRATPHYNQNMQTGHLSRSSTTRMSTQVQNRLAWMAWPNAHKAKGGSLTPQTPATVVG
jgi:hypothetical protein